MGVTLRLSLSLHCLSLTKKVQFTVRLPASVANLTGWSICRIKKTARECGVVEYPYRKQHFSIILFGESRKQSELGRPYHRCY